MDNKSFKPLVLLLLVLVLVVPALACISGKSEENVGATATAVAAGIFATQTAEAPTPTRTPLPVLTSTPTTPPTPTSPPPEATPTSPAPAPTEETSADTTVMEHIIMSALYAASGDYEKGLAEADAAIALDPSSAEGWYWEGLCLRNLDRPLEAIKALDTAISLDPNHAEAYRLRGYAYSDIPDVEKSLADLEKYLEIAPADSEYREQVEGEVETLKAIIAQGGAAPAPTPTTPPPTPSDIPPGKGKMVIFNNSGYDLVMDIIRQDGATVATEQIPSGGSHAFILDPGTYNYNGSVPGMGGSVTGDPMVIQEGKVLEFTIN